MINCPSCGSPVLANQQYCRVCGAEILSERPRRAIPIQFWGLLMAFGGIFVAMSGKMFDIRWLIFAGVFVSIFGMFFIAAIPFLRSSLKRKARPTGDHQPEPQLAAPTTRKLRPISDNDYIPSVIEGTTDLLKDPVRLRSDRKV